METIVRRVYPSSRHPCWTPRRARLFEDQQRSTAEDSARVYSALQKGRLHGGQYHCYVRRMGDPIDEVDSSAPPPRDQRIRDPVHGLITFRASEPLDRLAWALIDTPEFQRMRRIKQLGVSEFVFPSATHTRFTHSIGVFHTARSLIGIIRREIKKEDFDRSRAEVALIAALLHDLGHGPFSHMFESVQKARNVPKRHEKWTAEIVRKGPGIAPLLAAYRSEFRDDDRLGEDVAAMLEAEDPIDLYHAVVSSSFDADRLDYLQRDRLMTGTQAGAIDFDWLLEHVRVLEVPIEAADPDDEGELAKAPTFCLDEKALPAAEQFLLARYTLHEQVYFHKTTRSIEYLISRLLGHVAELAQTSGEAGQVGLTLNHPIWHFFMNTEPSLDAYLALDDQVIMAALQLMASAPDAIVANLAQRLRTRDLYKTLDTRRFGHDGGRQKRAERNIDELQTSGKFEGQVHKDQGAKVSIYTQIGGDDERMHKKLHVVDSRGPREITDFSPLIEKLAEAKQFTRYYFETESDRNLAKRPRGRLG
jgi:HD superfamily phosphohydrolase